MNKATITWTRIGNGEFHAAVDGVKASWSVINGAAGLTGRETPNMYLPIHSSGKLGLRGGMYMNLAGAKKLAEGYIRKEIAGSAVVVATTGVSVKYTF